MIKKSKTAFVNNLMWEGGNKKKIELKDVGKTIKAAKQSKVYDKEKYSSSSAEVVANVASMIMAAAGKGKVMDKYVEIAKIGTSLLTGTNKSEIVVSHSNNYIRNNKTTIKKSIIHVGKKGKGMITNPPSFHSTNNIELINTDTDAIDPYRKEETVSKIGFSQRRVDIFLNDTFMTIGNVKELISFDKEIKEIEEKAKLISSKIEM